MPGRRHGPLPQALAAGDAHLVHDHVLHGPLVCAHVPRHLLAGVHAAWVLGPSRGPRLAVGLAVAVAGWLSRKAMPLHDPLEALADGGACP